MAPDSERGMYSDLDEAFSNDELDLEAYDDGPVRPRKSRASYEDQLKAAAKEIKGKKRFTHDEDVAEFFRQYDDIAGEPAGKGDGNILHALIDVVRHTEDVKPDGIELLVRQVVKDWPSRLLDANKECYNPLHLAIRNKQNKLVAYMVSACVDKECLQEALMMKAQDGNTCLHFAFLDSLHAETRRMLVENASDAALAAQNDNGKTPVHYAVWIKHCMGPGLKLISLFLDRDLELRKRPRQRDTFLDLLDGSGMSVYREHEQSRLSLVRKPGTMRQQKAEAIKQAPAAVARPGARTAPRDVEKGPRDLPERGRDLRPGAVGDPERDRNADKYRGARDNTKDLDDREEKRKEMRRAEAARNLKKAEEAEGQSTEEIRRPDAADALRARERDASGREGGRIPPARVDASNEKAAELPVPAQHAVQAGLAGRHPEPAPNTPLKRSSTARFDRNPEQPRPKEKDQAKRQLTPELRDEFLRNSDDMRLMLKLHYMRTRSAEKVISFLYGNNLKDIQISFDYDHLPAGITWSDFTKRFGPDAKSGLQFDPVLQYVTFPRVEVAVTGRQADLKRASEPRPLGPLGRKDMEYFFDWLYKKGVRHIIRVSVEDSGASGGRVHSDGAIQTSLERFIVEHLDWKKTDLDPETILAISSKVAKKASAPENTDGSAELVPNRQLRHLALKWSGSNAVLRGWSEQEGLALLPHLATISLSMESVDKTYDNQRWIDTRVGNFKARLNANRQAAREQDKSTRQQQPPGPAGHRHDTNNDVFGPVEVVLEDPANNEQRRAALLGTAHSSVSAPLTENSHRWLNSTSRFAGAMESFWKSSVESFLELKQHRPAAQEGPDSEVVLALIDDGVDMFGTPQTGRILEGKSFDFHDGKVRPPYSSANGHGTIMARMILKVCPMVKVYPIRLKTYESAQGKNMNIDAGYAAQAIRAALDKKATIISMSWTVPATEGKGDRGDKKKLRAVLQEAVDKKVLMFCSAPDNGKFTDNDYPSGPWRDRFFRIGAAGADGTVFNWTPEDGITCVLPGINVPPESDTAFYGAHSKRAESLETGSSVATALGAGLAAMIIYCLKATILVMKTENPGDRPHMGIPPDDAPQTLARPDEMKLAFAALGKPTANNFIPVWEELDKVSEQLEALQDSNLSPEDRLKHVNSFVEFGLKLWNASKQNHRGRS